MAKQTTTKKPHWLSTPEGKAKMSRIQKARYARAREQNMARDADQDIPPPESRAAQVIAHARKNMAVQTRIAARNRPNYAEIASDVIRAGGLDRLMIAIGLELLRVQNNHG
jgi:hypothetical protein